MAQVPRQVNKQPVTVMDLDAVEEPQFTMRFDGQERSWNPWTVTKKLAGVKLPEVAESGDMEATADVIRKAFDLPVLASGEKTFTVQQALAAMVTLFTFVKEMPELKKLSALTQN